MTKKRKRYPDLNQKLERPWCYYCERDFDDLKILISHQKAKHFKCERCGRRLNTAGGLSVHMNQVHKENLTQVENAVPGRSGLDIEIFGMEGVPQDVIDTHINDVTHKHFEEEAERARVTGNPVRGAFTNGTAPPNKRAKVKETLEEIVERATKFRIDKVNGVLPAPPVETKPEPSPPMAQPFAPPAQASPFPPGAQQFPPPGAPQFPPGQFPPGGPQGFVPGFGGPPGGPPPFPSGGSPVNGGIPPRPGSIPGQPGLPQRPPFGGPPGAFNGAPPGADPAIAASVDELISSAAAAAEPAPEKKSKKDKNIRLVYSDERVSPEEKMASLSRYAAYMRT